MLSGGVGDMIDELGDRVWALEFWPLESAQPREEVAAETDARKSSRELTAHACVQTVGRGGCIQIAWQSGLIQTVVTDAGFIHPVRSRGVNPIASHHLCAGVNVRKPF